MSLYSGYVDPLEVERILQEREAGAYNPHIPILNQQPVVGRPGIGYNPNRSMAQAAAIGALGQAGSSLSSGLFGTINSLIQAKNQRDLQNNQFNFAREVYERDLKRAHQFGLVDPSQLMNLGRPASTDTYVSSLGRPIRVPMTSGPSPFSL